MWKMVSKGYEGKGLSLKINKLYIDIFIHLLHEQFYDSDRLYMFGCKLV